MLYDGWEPNPEADGTTVFIQAYDQRGLNNERKKIYVSATTPDLYTAKYAGKVRPFLTKLFADVMVCALLPAAWADVVRLVPGQPLAAVRASLQRQCDRKLAYGAELLDLPAVLMQPGLAVGRGWGRSSRPILLELMFAGPSCTARFPARQPLLGPPIRPRSRRDATA
jgi:hypothetical protein